VLSFDSVRWDTDGLYSASQPTRLTVQKSGRYLVYAHVRFSPNTTGCGTFDCVQVVGLAVNGSVQDIARANGPLANSGDGNIASISTHWEFAAGDFVEVRVKHNHSGSVDVEAAPRFTPEFGMVKLP
jgi:hypothetical protein